MEIERTDPNGHELERRLEVISDLFSLLDLQFILNRYTLENVSLGRIAPNQAIPFDNYVRDLRLHKLKPYRFRDQIETPILGKNLTVVDKSKSYFCQYLFCEMINFRYYNAPKQKNGYEIDGEYGLFKYKNGLREYLVDLYPLCASIFTTDVAYDTFDIMPCYRSMRDYFLIRNQMFNFLYAMKCRGLRQGSVVDRYFKNSPRLPIYMERIVEQRGLHYRIINNDIHSLDYKLALLNSMCFLSEENANLFEIKTKKWETSKNIDISYHLDL